jgi:intracellular septation protein
MLKFLTEFSPLIAFFAGYKIGGILKATLYMLITAVATICITYAYERKISKINLISTIVLLISASLTLFSGNPVFVKMKPTILYTIFAGIFLITNYKWNPAIQYILGHNIKFNDTKNWHSLNLRFMWFFSTMAIANEIIWRNFDENTWVNFKIFGTLPLTLIFVMLQIPFIMRNQDKESSIGK